MGSKIQRPTATITVLSYKIDESIQEPRIQFKSNKDLYTMLQCAESGYWSNVFEFLDTNPILINQIPSDKEWGVLHWAAYKNNYIAVSRLFKYTTCDITLRANTPGKLNGDRPVDLTQLPDLESLLLNQSISQKHLSLNIPNIIQHRHKGIAISHCINTSLNQYSGILFPESLNLDKTNFIHLLDEVYSFISGEENWISVRNALSDTVSGFHSEIARNILQHNPRNLDSRNAFFTRLVQQFIQERHCLYHTMNSVVYSSDDDVIADDYVTALAPYAFVLNSILLSWGGLKSNRGKTYLIARDEYSIGDTFVWFSFVLCSSSPPVLPLNGDVEKYVIVEIDNANTWKWCPKFVGDFTGLDSSYLYPFGAKFSVTDRSDDTVYLQLKNF